MEPRAHHILIGTATLVAIAAALLFALWLNGSGQQRDSKQYDIVFNEAVTGLSVGNAVNYSGIRVGEVASLSLDPVDPRKVWARIRVASDIPITDTTRARLTLANITGAAIIQLTSGPPGGTPLKGRGGKTPVIVAEPSPFSQLRTNSEELLANISLLVENASKVLSDENTSRLSRILDNIDTATGAVADQKDAISQGIAELAEASHTLRNSLNTTAALVDRFNASYEAHGDNLFSKAGQSLDAIQQLSGKLEQLVDDNRGAIGQGAQGLAELGPAIAELRQTLDALNGIARQLEEDPTGYLLGGEKIREYTP